MSDTAREPPQVRHPYYKDHVDWAALFGEIAHGSTCAAVAMTRGVNPRTLQWRYKAWREATAAGDVQRIAAMSGQIDGRRYSHSALTFDGDNKLAAHVKELKRAKKPVDRAGVSNAALEQWAEEHPRPLRSSTSFTSSSHFLTRFRRRHHLSTTREQHHVSRPTTAEKENQRLAETAEYHMRVDEAVQQYGPHLVINADETPAKAVEARRSSWSVSGEPNTVETDIDERRGITTTAAIAADGSLLPLQAIAKGKTQRAIKNRQLPANVVADCSIKGWQTSATTINFVNNVIAPYTNDAPSALILDDYAGHWTAAVQAAAADRNIELIHVPEGQTGELQPLDVAINGQVKSRARRQWVQDKQEGRADADTLGQAVGRIDSAYRAVKRADIVSAFRKARHGLPR